MLENSLHASVDVISREIRFMSVNPGFVEFDGSFQVMLFHIPKLISGVDISSKSAEVVYGFDPKKPEESYRTVMTLWTLDGDYCIFRWTIPFAFFAEKRWAFFQVRIRTTSGNTVESQWSTKLKKVYVTPGFTGGQEAYTQAQQDAIAALNSRVTALEASEGGSGSIQLQVDQTPTENSQNLVTSGGVWQAFEDIEAGGDVESVNGKTGAVTIKASDLQALPLDFNDSDSIPNDSDFNDYNTPGSYRVNSSANAGTMANIPSNAGGRLIVMSIYASARLIQIYIPMATSPAFYIRTKTNSDSWNGWITLQNKLTFDSAPTQGSTNPVTSGGVYTAIQNAGGGSGGVGITVDDALSATSENPVQNKVIYQALQNSSGGSSGWTQLDSSVFGFTTSGQSSNIGSIDNVEARYCQSLGIVMFSLTITTSGAIEGSVNDAKEQRIAFDPNLHYKPYFIDGSKVAMGAIETPWQGGSMRLQNAYITRTNVSSNVPYISVATTASIPSGSSRSFSGFYYTEDLPT